ncbi:MAG: hypothetical protein A2289_01425 [Deltaproteobacteria bacterium RIFOXYA12_FULL_58_15]|nr:MAG: hypothetical protein A2289_01425 [Deltaproteobacteria bacterium RIFOXYA12_FULL_58_15]OGR14048.1 MAG: hypothetical protein A2341_19080 [Deltaproteobacteria bacterium RIFOXYB12_FULL_58_9]
MNRFGRIGPIDRLCRIRPLCSVVGVAFILSLPRVALPCGGGFGAGIEIDPAQTIVLHFENGVETYVFNPYFCGEATEFGLILPVPSTLRQTPELADADLAKELEALTAPRVVTECQSSGGGCGGARGGSKSNGLGMDRSGEWYPGVDVVDAGEVGIFDWTLLQADTATAFTDWLDANSFPYDEQSAAHFSYYANQSWYFVAFKVTAGDAAPPLGSKLCGELGPLVLQFEADQPVIPARIAAVNQSAYAANAWRIIAIAASQLRLTDTRLNSDLLYSGTISDNSLAAYPAIASLGATGERVTKLDVFFPWEGVDADIYLEVDPNQGDFRQTVVEYEECGCSAATSALLPVLFVAAFAIPIAALMRRRRRRSDCGSGR